MLDRLPRDPIKGQKVSLMVDIRLVHTDWFYGVLDQGAFPAYPAKAKPKPWDA